MTACVIVAAGLLYFQGQHWFDPGYRAALMVGCALFAGFLWQRFWRIYHYIADTPTSRVETAAQGLSELHGTGELLAGKLSQGIAMGPPSLWQSYSIMRGEDQQESGVSTAPFQLIDKSGSCIIYPEGATVISSSRANPRQGELRASIHYLKPGADIYVLGEFKTIGGDNDDYDIDRETTEVLRRWKTDQRQLVADYDRDGDGRIDADEWQAARDKARKVAQENIERRRFESKVIHEIRRPTNGLPLIISDKDPAYLERRFYWMGIFNLSFALVCFVTGALMLR